MTHGRFFVISLHVVPSPLVCILYTLCSLPFFERLVEPAISKGGHLLPVPSRR